MSTLGNTMVELQLICLGFTFKCKVPVFLEVLIRHVDHLGIATYPG